MSGEPRRIPFLEPELPELDLVAADLREIYASGVYSNGGPFDRRLGRGLAEYLGVADCVPVSNATTGLMLAIEASARRDGARGPRKVLVPSFTFPATALAAEWAGFEPVFCDIDSASWQPAADPSVLEEHAEDLALIVACNTFGSPCDLAAWQGLAERHGVPLIVDSASALGGEYADGRRIGAAGSVEVFSMHITKPFAVGEGGIVATDDEDLAQRLRRMRNFGFDEDRICRDKGINAKLSELHAAIGCRVLEGYDGVVKHRRRIAACYREALGPLGFVFQEHAELSPYQAVSVCVPAGVRRDDLQAALESEGIETRRYFATPLHRQPRFRTSEALGSLDVTDDVAMRILSLPTSNRLTTEEVSRVCDAISRALDRAGASVRSARRRPADAAK